MIISDLNIILPEIILSVYAMLALVGAVYTAKDELATTLCWLTSIPICNRCVLDFLRQCIGTNCFQRHVH